MWSDEAKELAKQCHGDGLSASHTAAVLNNRTGISFTRNAVIGCWFRMGLSKAMAGDVAAMVQSANRSRRLARRGEQRAARLATTTLETVFVPPQQHRKQLHELTNTSCRWPYGEPGTQEFFFCGNAANLEADRPYCAHHMRLAGNPQPKYSNGYTSFLSMLGR